MDQNNRYSAQKKYAAKNKKQIPIDFIIATEQDLLDWLEKQPNKAGYIKSLIKADMKKEA